MTGMRLDGRLFFDAIIVASAIFAALFSSDPDSWRFFILFAWLWAAVGFFRWKSYGYTVGEVLLLAVVLRLIFLLSPLGLSDDYFRYVWDGMIQHAGINPFLFQPDDLVLSQFHAEPVYGALNSGDFFSVYPPVSQMAFYAAGFFYSADISANILFLRLLFVFAEMAAVLILVRLVGPAATALYALNPLIVIEVAGELHTEAFMVFFLVVAMWGWNRSRPRWMVAGIFLAGLVKLYPLVLLPFAMRRAGLGNSLPGLFLGAVLCIPYASAEAAQNVIASLDLYVRFFEFNAGPYYAVKEIGYALQGEDLSKTIGPVFRWIFLATLPAIFILDRRFQWTFAYTVFTVFAALFLLSTTVHPWYLIGIVAVAPMLSAPPFAWLFLGAASLGTYERYTGGFYWEVVAVSWGLFAVIALVTNRDTLLETIQRFRAKRKTDLVEPYLLNLRRKGTAPRIADIGAGEGYVGAEIGKRLQVDVELIDTVDMNRTALKHTTYDGRSLPHTTDCFDASLLAFVLHHAEAPEQVVTEAVRVTRGPVIVVESVYGSQTHRRVLEVLDRLANRVRSGGKMKAQEAHLHFRTVDQWRRMFKHLGFHIRAETTRGKLIHIQHVFVLSRQ